MRSVLNVGGGNKSIPIPPHFDGWRHDLLDIDPRGNPDVLADARNLLSLPGGTYDAIYCSHNLEHYHRHEAAKVVRGFSHMIKPDGFAQIIVPDVMSLMRRAIELNLDTDDVLYESPAGPIQVRDVLFGYHVEIERSNSDFYLHKTCFSTKSLVQHMLANGFPVSAVGSNGGEVIGFFFKQPPSAEWCSLLNLRA